MKLSIIVPVYNEERTIISVLKTLLSTDFGVKKEIIVVDDGSTDDSKKAIKRFLDSTKKTEIKFMQKQNGGKGSAVRKGIEVASGDVITIQDADLEYDPRDFRKLIRPIIEGKERVVYGSRFLKEHKPLYRVFFLGNKFLTLLTQILYGSRITDMETCYKVFRKDVIRSINIKANKFDIEPEVTAKVLKKKIKIREIPIHYRPRSVEEGKKINWKDGLQAIWTLVYWKFKKS